ncbi:MAG: hypothetical protein H6767_04840 [Candidatus Peribacteria bacterium]|nr:MAG: hypothetical protein H6767_04840 [Candidatus Peribacteria bacterium]
MTIGIKDLHKNLKNIPDMVDSEGDILVLKNSKPAFKISSIRTKRNKSYTMYDLEKMQFTSGDKDLGSKVDMYIY